MTLRKKIYVASPFGFTEAGRYFLYKVLIPTIERAGYSVLDPWKLTDQREIDRVVAMPFGKKRRDAWKKLNAKIGRNNVNAIDKSNGLVAVLDGTDVDSGTAGEAGYGYGTGRPVVGYRSDFRFSGENEGTPINLQIEFFVKASGCRIVEAVKKIPPELDRVFKW